MQHNAGQSLFVNQHPARLRKNVGRSSVEQAVRVVANIGDEMSFGIEPGARATNPLATSLPPIDRKAAAPSEPQTSRRRDAEATADTIWTGTIGRVATTRP